MGARGDGEFVYVMSAIRKLRNDVEATQHRPQPEQTLALLPHVITGDPEAGAPRGAGRARKRGPPGIGEGEDAGDAPTTRKSRRRDEGARDADT